MHTDAVPYLKEIVVFLVASVLVVPLFQWMKASPVLGYLAVGALIGPFGFAVIDDVQGVARLAELGVVFLLFTIGLELSFERLMAMRRLIFGLGGLQVLIVGTVIAFLLAVMAIRLKPRSLSVFRWLFPQPQLLRRFLSRGASLRHRLGVGLFPFSCSKTWLWCRSLCWCPFCRAVGQVRNRWNWPVWLALLCFKLLGPF